jgi:hypothetical protein
MYKHLLQLGVSFSEIDVKKQNHASLFSDIAVKKRIMRVTFHLYLTKKRNFTYFITCFRGLTVLNGDLM